MSLLLAIGALLKRIPWQLYVAIAIASAFGLLLIDRNHWKAADERDHATAVNYRRQLDSISTNRDVQKQVSTRTVEKVVQGQVQVRTIVQHIHDAPNPPDCGTPDISELRNVL